MVLVVIVVAGMNVVAMVAGRVLVASMQLSAAHAEHVIAGAPVVAWVLKDAHRAAKDAVVVVRVVSSSAIVEVVLGTVPEGPLTTVQVDGLGGTWCPFTSATPPWMRPEEIDTIPGTELTLNATVSANVVLAFSLESTVAPTLVLTSLMLTCTTTEPEERNTSTSSSNTPASASEMTASFTFSTTLSTMAGLATSAA